MTRLSDNFKKSILDKVILPKLKREQLKNEKDISYFDPGDNTWKSAPDFKDLPKWVEMVSYKGKNYELVDSSSISDASSQGIGDVNYYQKWFTDDVSEMLQNGDIKSAEEGLDIVEKNIRQIFEGALKSAKGKALQSLNKKK